MWKEHIREALGAISGSWLRSLLTILIIAFGITAMVGVLTSIDGVKYWMRNSFSTLGANTFVVQNLQSTIRVGGRRKRVYYPPITYKQALKLKERVMKEGAGVPNIKGQATFNSTAAWRDKRTNANISVIGTDENFLTVESFGLAEGRAITPEDVKHQRKVAVAGHEIKAQLFPFSSPVGQHIFIDKNRYLIIGLLEEKGSSFGSKGDKSVMLPITTLLQDYALPNESFEVNVYVPEAEEVMAQAQMTTGLMRVVRGLSPREQTNFAVILSDSFVEDLMANLAILTVSATFITIITLFGAAIGLMNIMLVSVTERTMEIGLRKSTGATRKQIMFQFLTEAVTICQLGGILGVLLGLVIGNVVGYFLDARLMIPWGWVTLGLGVCFVVGIVSGLYPARKASRMDPIDALRFE